MRRRGNSIATGVSLAVTAWLIFGGAGLLGQTAQSDNDRLVSVDDILRKYRTFFKEAHERGIEKKVLRTERVFNPLHQSDENREVFQIWVRERTLPAYALELPRTEGGGPFLGATRQEIVNYTVSKPVSATRDNTKDLLVKVQETEGPRVKQKRFVKKSPQ